MPHPTNYDTAHSVESIIRDGKVTPATIALIDGQVHIGLTDALLQQISDPGWKSVKVSRRDLAPVLSLKGNGGTTVAGTMYIAQSVGIPLFVTGGIGGVHRGAESSKSYLLNLADVQAWVPEWLEVVLTQGFRYGHFSGLDRTGPNTYGCSLRRCEIDPRHPQDARSTRNSGCLRCELWSKGVSRFLHPILRDQRKCQPLYVSSKCYHVVMGI